MTVRYRLGVCGLAVSGPARHDWAALGGLGPRRFEIGMLDSGEDLPAALAALRPTAFGVHWPLRAEDGHDMRLLEGDRAAFTGALRAIERRMAGTGAAYVLVHLSQRGEAWPEASELEARLHGLADLAHALGMEVVLEPKEAVGAPDGLAAFASRVGALPAGLAFCLDCNDWCSARRHLPPGAVPRVGAAHVHLHAMHLRPDGSGLYLHAPPWVDPGPVPGWPDMIQPDADELARLADGTRPVAINLEVDPRYLARMPDCLAAVRAHLRAAGWREEAEPAPGGGPAPA